MADIKSWSPAAASNNSAAPNGAPEGMSPSGVNDTLRENMAAVRRWYEDAEWRDFGDSPLYDSGTSFSVSGDLTGRYVVNRRIRAVGSSTGTIYGTITASSYSAPNTTVTVAWDSGSLVSETLEISLGFTPTNSSIPVQGVHGLYHGRVSNAGAATRLPSGWSASKFSTGAYRVTHNLGHTNYTAVANALNAIVGRQSKVSGQNSNDFTVLSDDGSSATDAGFNFTLILDE